MNYNYAETVSSLLIWYDKGHRSLAWRENPKPYYVWISEIMLQQTRVESVKGYFERFIQAVPDIATLSIISDDLLMKLWEGLGYYNRARNLKKTAVILMEKYDGCLPADYEKLLSLPGIGTYTAGAIASIAFGINVPAVDGNVLRVMKRVAGSFDDITKNTVKKQLEDDLKSIMPIERPGDYNQAIMELGAMVCIPNGKPLCKECPLNYFCRAYKEELTSMIPVKPKKKARIVEEKTIYVLELDGKYAIRKREEEGLLKDLWELPNESGVISYNTVMKNMLQWSVEVESIMEMSRAKHIFSHREWHMKGYYIKLKNQGNLPFHDIIWAEKEDLRNYYSLPTAFEAYKGFWKEN